MRPTKTTHWHRQMPSGLFKGLETRLIVYFLRALMQSGRSKERVPVKSYTVACGYPTSDRVYQNTIMHRTQP